MGMPQFLRRLSNLKPVAPAVLAILWVLTISNISGQINPVAVPPVVTENLRAIPDDNLAYPVFIIIGTSTGSGFYLNAGQSTFLVTAKHVLIDPSTQKLRAPAATLISYSKDLNDTTRNNVTLNLLLLQTNKDLMPHPSQDVLVAKLFDLKPEALPSLPQAKSMDARAGVTVVSVSKSGFLTVDSKNVKTFDQVLTGNDVMLFGYPTSLGLKQFAQLDPVRPLLRKGIVAGTNPATKTIVLDCPAYFGNSGGPVLEIDRKAFGTQLSIIGIVDQYVPFVQEASSQTIGITLQTNSGYSLAIPMDDVLELAK